MQTDHPFPDDGPATGSCQDIPSPFVTSRPLGQILHRIPKSGVDDTEDLHALRDWVKAKLDRETHIDTMYTVIRSSPWRVG